ncbi:2',3'-cyclic-nucleotide 2'-phosphodiesterase [Thioclava sp. BHET1]|nr:2',3'-cyclic-nucleotide 2'-phosphodiesterase [Thioclava sp. BHET1]
MEGTHKHVQQTEFDTERVTLRLRVLETTDLHGHVRAYDYFSDTHREGAGLAALAHEIAQARDQAQNSLLFDVGDFMQGTPLTQLWIEGNRTDSSALNPMISAMNTMGYDAGTLGNHEFDFGAEHLTQVLATAQFPIVGANIAFTRSRPQSPLAQRLTPWTILEREMYDLDGRTHRLRIGVIGFLTAQSRDWVSLKTGNRVSVAAPIAVARAEIARLRACQPDIVIALAHTGIAPAPKPPGNAVPTRDDAALALAEIDGIDVVLAGHDHLPFPGPHGPSGTGIDPIRGTLHGKPALNAGAYGTHLGVLDLTLQQVEGRWQITDHRAELRQPSGIESPAVVAVSDRAHHSALAHIRRRIGSLDTPLHSFFALLGPDPSVCLIHQVKLRHGRIALAGLPEAHLPLIAAAAPFKAGGYGGPGNFLDIPRGPVRMNHLDDLYMYNNALAAVEITGEALRDQLERAAGIFHQIPPGARDAELRDRAIPGYNFDVISGVSYGIDLAAPARYDTQGCARSGPGRIRDLCHEGHPVRPDQRFVLLTTNFRLADGGKLAASCRPIALPGPGASIRDLLIAEFRRHPDLSVTAEAHWRFAPMPDTRVLCHTSPKALEHLALLRAAGLSVETDGIDGLGFLRLLLSL